MEEDSKQPFDSPVQFSWAEGLRFRSPHRLFHKKFANTTRFVVSSKVWLHTIPTRDCDVLMTFPAHTPEENLMWVLSRLRTRAPELAVFVRHHSHTGVYGFYLTASYDSLLRGAEELSIRKLVKQDFGGGYKEFIYEDQDYFEGVEDSKNFFSSQERQSIVRNMLFNVRAVDGDEIGSVTFLEGQVIIPILISKSLVKEVLPLHNNDDLEDLRKNWVSAFFRSQPLDKICVYFGVKIAMYFTYLGHYTKALTLPAFLGLFIWLIESHNQAISDILFVSFAMINVVWSTLYLEHWKRNSAEYAYHWGTLDSEDELLVEPRPLYRGPLKKSPVTGRMEPNYPAWKRNVFRYLVSIPVICMCLGVVIFNMLIIFRFQDYINSLIKNGDLSFIFKFLPKIMLALCIGILDDIYKKIALWLNERENYRLDDTYETHLIIKLVLFQFVNSFLSLFYIAFYLQDMDRLKDQLGALLITRQVVGNIKEALVPYCLEKLKLYRIGYQMTEGMSPDTLDRHMQEMTRKGGAEEESKETAAPPPSPTESQSPTEPEKEEEEEEGEKMTIHRYTDDGKDIGEEVFDVSKSGPQLTQAEVEAAMKKYEDTYEDYLEMFIQFGYVTLFSSAFPMAAMCALVNNVIEIRSDAFKLCTNFQRPFSRNVENIGIWQDALEAMSAIAVVVNCALIGFSGLADRLFPDISVAERVVLIVVLEHIILATKILIAYAIPDLPLWVAEEKARLEFMRREALKKVRGRADMRKVKTAAKKWMNLTRKLEGGNTNSETAPIQRVNPLVLDDEDTLGDLSGAKLASAARFQTPPRKSPSPARDSPVGESTRRESQRSVMTSSELEGLREEILRAKERTPVRGEGNLRQRKTATKQSSPASSTPTDRMSPLRQADFNTVGSAESGVAPISNMQREASPVSNLQSEAPVGSISQSEVSLMSNSQSEASVSDIQSEAPVVSNSQSEVSPMSNSQTEASPVAGMPVTDLQREVSPVSDLQSVASPVSNLQSEASLVSNLLTEAPPSAGMRGQCTTCKSWPPVANSQSVDDAPEDTHNQ